jgi:hypothetical protein
MDFDLDLQLIEYRNAAERWAEAVDPRNLLLSGDLEGETPLVSAKDAPVPAAWKEFAVDPRTVRALVAEGAEKKNHFLRVSVGGEEPRTADGGFVQRVDGLDRAETYRLACRVRSSWPVDPERRCAVGYDATGQTEDPKAATITWTALPPIHGVFVPYQSPPIRPAAAAISVWLRGTCTARKLDPQLPFRADFDDLALRRVKTEAPGG